MNWKNVLKANNLERKIGTKEQILKSQLVSDWKKETQLDFIALLRFAFYISVSF